MSPGQHARYTSAMMTNNVAITGMGLVLPGSPTPAALWDNFIHGTPMISAVDVPGFDKTVPAGRVAPLSADEFVSAIPEKYFNRYPLDIRFYLASCMRALADADLDLHSCTPERTGVFDGTSRGSFSYWTERLRRKDAEAPAFGVPEFMFGTPGQAASIAASLFGIEGPVNTLSTTCTSGSVAIGQAYREIASGRLDVALASGHEAPINPVILETYEGAGLISFGQQTSGAEHPLVPGFSGVVLGEGAVTLVLENAERARQRGATILGIIAGYEHGNMGQHPTHVDPTGDRASRLIRHLLENTGLPIDRVRAVFGHGNGREASDTSEKYYMEKIFGALDPMPPLYSLKPIFGHIIGASGAINVAAAALLASRRYQATAQPPANVELSMEKPAASISDIRAGECILAVAYGVGGHCTAMAVCGD